MLLIALTGQIKVETNLEVGRMISMESLVCIVHLTINNTECEEVMTSPFANCSAREIVFQHVVLNLILINMKRRL